MSKWYLLPSTQKVCTNTMYIYALAATLYLPLACVFAITFWSGFFQDHWNGSAFFYIISDDGLRLLIVPTCWLIASAYGSLQIVFLRRIEQSKQEGALRNQEYKQSKNNSGEHISLSLPLLFQYKRRLGANIALGIPILYGLFLVTSPYIAQFLKITDSAFISIHTPTGWDIPCIIIFPLSLILVIYISFADFSPIRITQQGIDNIPWEDIDLFACYSRPDSLGGTIFAYEFASKKKSVVWYDLEKSHSWMSIWKHTQTKEAYNQQISILNAYICERTGLPLYDLTNSVPIVILSPQETKNYQEKEDI